MLILTACGQNLSCTHSLIASDSVDYLTAYFNFSSDWDELVKTAQFTQNQTTYSVLLDNNKCVVPHEITSGLLEISVFGQKSGQAKRITTIPCTVNVEKSGFCSTAQQPIPPTPDLYSQLISSVESAFAELPDSLSGFNNDMGFVTAQSLPTRLSQLDNDMDFVTAQSLPTDVVRKDENDNIVIFPEYSTFYQGLAGNYVDTSSWQDGRIVVIPNSNVPPLLFTKATGGSSMPDTEEEFLSQLRSNKKLSCHFGTFELLSEVYDYAHGFSGEKDGVPTNVNADYSLAVGEGLTVESKNSIATGALSKIGISDDLKKQYICNYLNIQDAYHPDGDFLAERQTVRVPSNRTYYDLKLKVTNSSNARQQWLDTKALFIPTNGTSYQPSDIDLSLLPEDFFIKFGNNSVIGGYKSDAFGQSNLIIGNYNSTYGHTATAIGYSNIAYNYADTAIGVGNEVGYWSDKTAGHEVASTGHGAVAIGSNNKIQATNAVGIGEGLLVKQADTSGGVYVGQYNATPTRGAIFSVGNGTSNTNRKTAIEVTKDKVKITSLADPVNDTDAVNKQYADRKASQTQFGISKMWLTVEGGETVLNISTEA